jgi:hypothetical protein
LAILDDTKKREELGRMALERVRTSLHWGLSRQVLLQGLSTNEWPDWGSYTWSSCRHNHCRTSK